MTSSKGGDKKSESTDLLGLRNIPLGTARKHRVARDIYTILLSGVPLAEGIQSPLRIPCKRRW